MSLGQELIGEASKIHIATKGICNFFGGLGKFISQSRGFPSYFTVRGKEIEEIPDNLLLEQRVYPVINKSPKDLSLAIKSCEKLGRKVFRLSKDKIAVVRSREFMICGSTLPILIQYDILDKRKPDERAGEGALYVKQMNLHRLFMGTLYYLAIGEDYPLFLSEESIFEPGINGSTLNEAYRKDQQLLSSPELLREIVKLSVVSYLLSLYDMDNDMNILVQGNRLKVVDFDKAFWERIPSPRETLINPFTYETTGSDGKTKLCDLPDEKLMRRYGHDLDDLVSCEMSNAHRNISANIGLFHAVIEEMSHVDYYNIAAQHLYGMKDIGRYFTSRLEEFRAALNQPKNGMIRRLL
ncbi:MAG: hypothetical protein AABX47_02030 [Nanoarchaeota archaeon]